MKRWGMLEEGEIPEPNVNIRMAIEWLDTYADDMPLSVLGTVIPMLEVALDGALLKFLLEEVHDPVCHQVFEKINNDESRHIAVDFEVLDMIGHAKARKLAIDFVANVASPGPDHRRADVHPAAQPDAQQPRRHGPAAGEAVRARWSASRSSATAASTPTGSRSSRCSGCTRRWSSTPSTRTTCSPTRWSTLSEHYPRALFRPIPTWFKELTYEPVTKGVSKGMNAA